MMVIKSNWLVHKNITKPWSETDISTFRLYKNPCSIYRKLYLIWRVAAIFFPSHDKNVSSGGILSARQCLRTRIFFLYGLTFYNAGHPSLKSSQETDACKTLYKRKNGYKNMNITANLLLNMQYTCKFLTNI